MVATSPKQTIDISTFGKARSTVKGAPLSAEELSKMVTGRAERLTKQQDIDRAMQFIKERNSTLSPAINRTWIDAWGRANVIAIYRIHHSEMSGRKTY